METAETLITDVRGMLDTIAEWEEDDPTPEPNGKEPPKKGWLTRLLKG